jgi:excisionase family DNA binding protein
MKDITVVTIGVEELKEIITHLIESKLSPVIAQSSQHKESENELITREETAKKLRISLPTLGELTKAGFIKGYRIGRRVLYKWGEVENDLQQINYTKYQRKDLK